MNNLDNDGDVVEFQGSGARPYTLKNVQGVLSCSCPAWRNQSLNIDKRTCKHLGLVRGAGAEAARVGSTQRVTPAAGVNIPTITSSSKPPSAEWAMLAESWSMGEKMTGWYRSEKLDGVRLKWDPKRKCFVTRAGNIVNPPAWFVEDFPTVELDGELWMGRGKFQDVSSLARSANGGDRWKNAFYMIFDMPIERQTWEERLDRLLRMANDAGLQPHGTVQRLAKKGFILPQYLVQNEDELMIAMDEVIAKGGEGLMLKKPRSLYVPRRSPALLKMKRFHTDDARVTEVLEGNGRHTGTMGALKVRNRAGAIFAVGSGFTDGDRRSWWGAKDIVPSSTYIIEFQYQELDAKSGIPRFPTFKRIRTDLNSL